MKMAEGRSEEVVKPFSTRILHVALVRGILQLGDLATDHAFRVIGIVSLILLTTVVISLLRSGTSALWIAFPVLLTPLLFQLFRTYYLPDLFHAALLALFFFSFSRSRLLGLVVLCALYLTRETTALLGLWLVIPAVVRQRLRLAASVIVISAVGIAVTWFVVDTGLDNIHGVDSFTYLALKLPMNFLRNVFGIELWSNTLNNCRPFVTYKLPSWLQQGSIDTVGICP